MASSDSKVPTAISLPVDINPGDVSRMEEMTLASVVLRERQDLQRWITMHPAGAPVHRRPLRGAGGQDPFNLVGTAIVE